MPKSQLSAYIAPNQKNSIMKILVTGADGLLGSNVVRILLERGHQLRAFIQSGKNPITLEGLDIEKVEGDLLDPQSLYAASHGIEAIFHIAANTSIQPSRSSHVNKVNIDGTRNILHLAKEIGVQRLVYVGTACSFSFGTKADPGHEGTAFTGGGYGLDYIDSKYKAHQLVMEAVEHGLPAVVVCPTFMMGAFDTKPSSGAMIIAVHQQKLPGYAPGGKNFICVKDAAVATANALTKGKIGECYILGNENLSYNEAFSKIATVLDVKRPKLGILRWATLGYGMFGSLVAILFGIKPTVSYAMAKIACDGQYFSAERAIRELELPQTPIEEGIRESYNWMNANGIAD